MIAQLNTKKPLSSCHKSTRFAWHTSSFGCFLVAVQVISGFLTVLLCAEVALGQSLERWEFGAGPGFVSGSPSGTQFAEVFTADYHLRNSQVSLGPMVQTILPGSYTQVAGAVVARYHIPIWPQNQSAKNGIGFKLSPFIGLGGLYSELKQSAAGVETRSTDISYYATVGLSFDLDLNNRFGLSGTYMNNIYDIYIGSGHDRNSSAFFFTLRFRPDSRKQG